MKSFADGDKYILLSERIEEQDGKFTAFCDELGIGTFALSYDAASRRLTKSILLMLNKATEHGDIDELISECEIRQYPLERESIGLTRRTISSIEAAISTFTISPGTAHRAYLLPEAVE